MEFSKPEYLTGLPFPFLRDLPDPGIQLTSPALAGGFFTTEPPCFTTVLKLYKITDTCNFLSQYSFPLIKSITILLNYLVYHYGGGLVARSCLTLATPWTVACQVPLSMKILQARILEWVATSFSRGSS